ncbi:MAG: hypothetical protein AAGJ81_15840 [Verrucomicrobiota bacterium]
MHEWHLQQGSRKSTTSEEPFLEGQTVRSVLCHSEDGLVRLDFNPEEEVSLKDYRPIAQWLRLFRSNQSERETARAAVESADELFDQMMSGLQPDSQDEEHETKAALRFLLALHLERKRVLRPVGRPEADGVQVYRHPKRNRRYEVKPVIMEGNLLRKLKGNLDVILR